MYLCICEWSWRLQVLNGATIVMLKLRPRRDMVWFVVLDAQGGQA